jgi:hypothetical protein
VSLEEGMARTYRWINMMLGRDKAGANQPVKVLLKHQV